MSQFILSQELPESDSALQLFASLVSGKIKPGSSWNRAGYRLKFLLRALTLPLSSHHLLANLARNDRLQEILLAQPALPLKIYRPYLAANLGHQQVVEALSQHYLQLEKHLPASLFEGYLSADGVVLVRLQGKNDETYRIRLLAMDQLNKEGEATLLFENEQGVQLATTTFSVFNFQHQQTLFIGGIQGARPETPHEAIQLATKACHGLFPKRLLIEALCALASHLGVQQILAAGNKTHIYQSWRYHYKKKAQLFADYDAFWQSLSGELTDDNYFQLPLRVERKSLDDIASKKRAEYRRRYSLLDSLETQLDSQLRH